MPRRDVEVLAALSVDNSDPTGLSCSVVFVVFSGSLGVVCRWMAFSIGSNGRSAGGIGRYIAGSMAALHAGARFW